MTYRPTFHITAPTGRLNDPNGMFMHGSTLHVYYQKDPAFPFGKKRTGWGHVSTTLHGDSFDHWQHHPDALYPDAEYDLNGCYSGGAVRDNDGQVYLFYTGNLKYTDSNGDVQRRATQNRVIVSDIDSPMGGVYRRDAKNPLIDGPAHGYTNDYRDPMITRDPAGGWRMVIGAQRIDGTPAVVLYTGENLAQWEFAGELEFDLSQAQPGISPDLLPGGYMWECPNLMTFRDEVTDEDLDVLIICPQGVQSYTDEEGVTHYQSSDQCGYVVGKLRGTTFEVVRGFSELDYGHQFYAPQIIAEKYLDSRQLCVRTALLLGWMGLPAQDENPSIKEEGWVHSLTVPRRIRLRNHRLIQEFILPDQVLAAVAQRNDSDNAHTVQVGKNVYYLREFLSKNNQKIILCDMSGLEVFSLSYLLGEKQYIELALGADVRRIPVTSGNLEIFLDGNALEVLIDGGKIAAASIVNAAPGEMWDTFYLFSD
ncbi:beta-fructosidase, levanase/invertase [Corynebacterium kutscheri]|uniref:beta-fructofuranosidase n=1 Tax=Corynebacterium kutscheri TaxID=35755 RepID=A0A0F6QZ79_9CORY|nr:glycoside hydrolase family 32 protein [Corynebacterium kutscheri]AKE40565.1 beta-fructosidase, levanase/invertase [Corynebacterium kutscheri]VEH04950.1 sucrose-6-phosphate hydrolase [Corynebacterium kutscheri]VEH10960.1 sucrose-6-phosphate hydrolase [Corynebacterium kutscheri]